MPKRPTFAATVMIGKGERQSMRWHVRSTGWDRGVARFIAHRTTPPVERASAVAALAGDEHVLAAVVACVWLASRGASRPVRQRVDHLGASVVAAIVLSHLTKDLFWQQRPDRRVIHGRRHGVPRSGKPTDSFPSGHALQIGAVAAAVAHGWPRAARFAWPLCGVVAAARVVLLAHWLSDVLTGVAGGILLERLLRLIRL